MSESESRVLAGLGARAWTILAAALMTFVVPGRASLQEAQRPMESVAEASRNAREHKARSVTQARLFTNEDVGAQNPASNGSGSAEGTGNAAAQESTTPAGGCRTPEAARLQAELQATNQELDQVRSEFIDGTPVISGNNLDVKSFQPGYAGLDVGAPPTLDSTPPVSARLSALQLEERISALNKALRIACEPPEAAQIQVKLDEAEQELELLERRFALDNEAHYSKPNYFEDTAGKAQLDAESQEIENKRSEIARLREELAAVKSK
jgi:hypothetical protein